MMVAKTETGPGTCPDCEAPMKRRNGKFGPFYGCSRYPFCKCIVNIPAAKLDQWQERRVIRAATPAVKKPKRKRKSGWNGQPRRSPADARQEAMMDAEFRDIIG